ncbi:DUF6957 family protein [Pseudomonas sp. S37]|uniref:DUF6957 family protein n=1 Tax=Pseudomonas sp. S37 TaxID=2767449 RepID=UPI003FA75169
MHSDRGSIPVNDQSNRDIFKPALSCAVTSFQWGKQVDEHLISDILYGPAQSLSGSGLNDEGLARVAGEDYAGQEVCVVRHWLLLDVLLPEGEQSQLEREGLQATVLYANSIVYCSGQLIPDTVLSFSSAFAGASPSLNWWGRIQL